MLNSVLQLEYLDSSIKLLDLSWMILTFFSLTAQNDRTCTTTVLGFVLKTFREGAYLTFKSIFQSPPFILVRL